MVSLGGFFNKTATTTLPEQVVLVVMHIMEILHVDNTFQFFVYTLVVFRDHHTKVEHVLVVSMKPKQVSIMDGLKVCQVLPLLYKDVKSIAEITVTDYVNNIQDVDTEWLLIQMVFGFKTLMILKISIQFQEIPVDLIMMYHLVIGSMLV